MYIFNDMMYTYVNSIEQLNIDVTCSPANGSGCAITVSNKNIQHCVPNTIDDIYTRFPKIRDTIKQSFPEHYYIKISVVLYEDESDIRISSSVCGYVRDL